MKIAICVSGAFHSRGDLLESNKAMKNKFPDADFYYATWTSYKDKFEMLMPNTPCVYFEEPVVDYHPYLDIALDERFHGNDIYEKEVEYCKDKYVTRAYNSTKQILIHHWLADLIKDKYDIIIRTRFDVTISTRAVFKWDILDTLNNQRANGFASYGGDLDSISMCNIGYEDDFHRRYLHDMLIIHPASFVNVDLANTLHANKKLQGGELGWYQTLGKPHGSNQRSHLGWVDRVDMKATNNWADGP